MTPVDQMPRPPLTLDIEVLEIRDDNAVRVRFQIGGECLSFRLPYVGSVRIDEKIYANNFGNEGTYLLKRLLNTDKEPSR